MKRRIPILLYFGVLFTTQQIWHVLFLVFIIVVDIRVSQSAMSAAVDVITEWYDVFVT